MTYEWLCLQCYIIMARLMVHHSLFSAALEILEMATEYHHSAFGLDITWKDRLRSMSCSYFLCSSQKEMHGLHQLFLTPAICSVPCKGCALDSAEAQIKLGWFVGIEASLKPDENSLGSPLVRSSCSEQSRTWNGKEVRMGRKGEKRDGKEGCSGRRRRCRGLLCKLLACKEGPCKAAPSRIEFSTQWLNPVRGLFSREFNPVCCFFPSAFPERKKLAEKHPKDPLWSWLGWGGDAAPPHFVPSQLYV